MVQSGDVYGSCWVAFNGFLLEEKLTFLGIRVKAVPNGVY